MAILHGFLPQATQLSDYFYYCSKIRAVPRKTKIRCVCTCVFVCAQSLSCVHLFVTPWTVACQAPLSMEFTRQEYWSGLPFTSPGDHPCPWMTITLSGYLWVLPVVHACICVYRITSHLILSMFIILFYIYSHNHFFIFFILIIECF